MTGLTYMDSPPGALMIKSEGNAITRIHFLDDDDKREPERPTEVCRMAEAQLREYFLGQRKTFDLPLQWGGTAFQQRVWAEL
ncbi:MAG TPA: cysteine methyltransferase, partial [Phnomibacter sp.]|nr:cysteine methyltransferase [Phnomibacter sp.]